MANIQEQLQLEINESNSDLTESQQFISFQRNVMPYDVKKMELRNFLENIDKKLTPLNNLDHLQDVTAISEWICEKVRRRYQEV